MNLHSFPFNHREDCITVSGSCWWSLWQESEITFIQELQLIGIRTKDDRNDDVGLGIAIII